MNRCTAHCPLWIGALFSDWMWITKAAPGCISDHLQGVGHRLSVCPAQLGGPSFVGINVFWRDECILERSIHSFYRYQYMYFVEINIICLNQYIFRGQYSLYTSGQCFCMDHFCISIFCILGALLDWKGRSWSEVTHHSFSWITMCFSCDYLLDRLILYHDNCIRIQDSSVTMITSA